MSANLKNRNFLKLLDYSPEEITYLLELAADLKRTKKEGREVQKMMGKNIALIFEKSYIRPKTRAVSFIDSLFPICDPEGPRYVTWAPWS